jgi:hypothetical protein
MLYMYCMLHETLEISTVLFYVDDGLTSFGGLEKEHELFGTGLYVCSDECKLALMHHLESNNIRVIGYNQPN